MKRGTAMIDLLEQIPYLWIVEITPLDENGRYSVTIMKPSGVEVSHSVGYDLENTLRHAIAITKDKAEFR